MYYSGIDLHKDNSFITTLDVKGKIVKQERLVNDKANAALKPEKVSVRQNCDGRRR